MHSSVRCLSLNPIVFEESKSKYKIVLRNPALPVLDVFLGKEKERPRDIDEILLNQRGVYFLRLKDSLYIGKSDEFSIRFLDHIRRRRFLWWCFISPKNVEQTFTIDALNAAESILISFWNEICKVGCGTRGSDRKPSFTFLQEAVLLTEAASAAFLWLIKNRLDLGSIPFKKIQGLKSWPECYKRKLFSVPL